MVHIHHLMVDWSFPRLFEKNKMKREKKEGEGGREEEGERE